MLTNLRLNLLVDDPAGDEHEYGATVAVTVDSEGGVELERVDEVWEVRPEGEGPVLTGGFDPRVLAAVREKLEDPDVLGHARSQADEDIRDWGTDR